MNRKLNEYIQKLKEECTDISDKRQEKLRKISAFIKDHIRSSQRAKLIFICKHNSRRSHLCHVWTTTLAQYFNLKNIEAYSGGTEVTAFNHRAAKVLERAGFSVINSGGPNPKYSFPMPGIRNRSFVFQRLLMMNRIRKIILRLS